jgi:hypothetical protein
MVGLLVIIGLLLCSSVFSLLLVLLLLLFFYSLPRILTGSELWLRCSTVAGLVLANDNNAER